MFATPGRAAWLLAAACASDTFSGGAGPPCGADDEGATRCLGDGAFERCRDGRWREAGLCLGGCAGGACGLNQCPDDYQRRCQDGMVVTCSPDVGSFTTRDPVACDAGEACVDGQCVGGGTACPAGRRYCDGEDVLECDPTGNLSERVETCQAPERCYNGLCQSDCDIAAARHSFVGCRYYGVDSDNNAFDGFADNDLLQYDIVVANPNTVPARVRVQEKVGGAWSDVFAVAVEPGATHVFALTCTGDGGLFGGEGGCLPDNARPDRHPEDTVLARGLAFRVDSDYPIAAYQFNSDDTEFAASSSGATLLMPESAIDTRYYALTLPQGPDQNRSWLEVVGAADGTSVTVRASTRTAAGPGIPALGRDESHTVTLDEGDVLQIASANTGDDVSGSFIEADKPVAVFAGHECANLTGSGCDGSDFGTGGDHIEEQMLPLVAWGKTFAAAHLRHPQQPERRGATWRVVASEPDTRLSFEAGPDVVGLPAQELVLDAGDVAQFATGVAVEGRSASFFLTADKPVMVAQFLPGETAQVLVVPIDQYLPDYVFLAPGFFADTLGITRPSNAEVLLDGAAPTAAWLPAGGGHEASWTDDLPDGAHRVTTPGGLKGRLSGIQLVGMDQNCSYAYVGGLSAERINPIE